MASLVMRPGQTHHFTAISPLCKRRRLTSLTVRAEKREDPDPGLGLKAIWYGAEGFGNLIGLTKPKEAEKTQSDQQDICNRADAVAAIKRDYDSNYFVSGRGEMSAYESDCLFADPFAGFKGVERFKKNVSNLGSLMEDIKLDMLDWRETDEALETKWRFSAVLTLPWRPRLAASGGTTHVFSQETGRVIKHIEAWDVEPSAVVRSLLKPSSRAPTNSWVKFFKAVDGGDAAGAWTAASPALLRYYALPVVGVSLITKAATGEGLPGVFLGTVEGFAYLTALAAGITEMVKLFKQQQSS